MSAIGYDFIPTPKNFKKVMFRTKLTLREYKVLDGISWLTFEYPEERKTGVIKTTCRQLGELIDLPYQHVAETLNKLSLKGIITFLQKGCLKKDSKNEPSIIKLNVTDSVTAAVTKMVTQQVTDSVTLPKTINKIKQQPKVTVVPSNSPSNNSPKENKEEIQKIIEEQFGKQNWEEKENLSSFEILPIIKKNDNDIINSEILNIKEKEQSNTKPEKYIPFGKEISTISTGEVKKNNKPLPEADYNELAPVAEAIGIKKTIFSVGIKNLAKRGEIHSIKSALKDIFSQMQRRINKIADKTSYFIGMCNGIEVNNNSTSTASYQTTENNTAPATTNTDPTYLEAGNTIKPHIKKAPGEIKREADIRQAELEKQQVEAFIKTISEDKLQEYHIRAMQDWKTETKGFMGAEPWGGYVEYKIKLYAEQEGIWKVL